jgi:hypothetical protein
VISRVDEIKSVFFKGVERVVLAFAQRVLLAVRVLLVAVVVAVEPLVAVLVVRVLRLRAVAPRLEHRRVAVRLVARRDLVEVRVRKVARAVLLVRVHVLERRRQAVAVPAQLLVVELVWVASGYGKKVQVVAAVHALAVLAEFVLVVVGQLLAQVARVFRLQARLVLAQVVGRAVQRVSVVAVAGVGEARLQLAARVVRVPEAVVVLRFLQLPVAEEALVVAQGVWVVVRKVLVNLRFKGEGVLVGSGCLFRLRVFELFLSRRRIGA